MREIEDESRTTPNVQEALVPGLSGESNEQLADALAILWPEERLAFIVSDQAPVKLDVRLLSSGEVHRNHSSPRPRAI